MTKLILKCSNLHSLNDTENIDLGNFYFDIKQFKVPNSMVIQKKGFSAKVEKEKKFSGELVETGKHTITFKVYDRPFIELVLQNGGVEIGPPITVIVEKQDKVPILDNYEDGEFIPISFTGFKVKPRRVQKKSFVAQGKAMIDTWQYAEIKVEADGFVIGDTDESKSK